MQSQTLLCQITQGANFSFPALAKQSSKVNTTAMSCVRGLRRDAQSFVDFVQNNAAVVGRIQRVDTTKDAIDNAFY